MCQSAASPVAACTAAVGAERRLAEPAVLVAVTKTRMA